MQLADLIPYIDWQFFFTAWELRGKFPAILEHPEHGAAARDVYQAGRTLLARIVDEKLLTANTVHGFWPARSEAWPSAWSSVGSSPRSGSGPRTRR